jgi:hypothetical protein
MLPGLDGDDAIEAASFVKLNAVIDRLIRPEQQEYAISAGVVSEYAPSGSHGAHADVSLDSKPSSKTNSSALAAAAETRSANTPALSGRVTQEILWCIRLRYTRGWPPSNGL